eukprot:jgi/Galph1/5758/GphlegSOOS_G4410.1
MRVMGSFLMCLWWQTIYRVQFKEYWNFLKPWKCLVLGIFGFYLWVRLPNVLLRFQRERTPHMYSDRVHVAWNPFHMPYSKPFKIVLFILKAMYTILLVPVIEEVQFRHTDYRFMTWKFCRNAENDWFNNPFSERYCWPSILLLSFGFGCCHLRYEFEWLAGFLYGIMVQLLTISDGNIVNAIVIHMITNFCLFIYALITRNFYFL